MSSATFYAVVLSAAATLMGLLFFAVLFNVDRKGHKLGAQWLSLATSTINVYVMLCLLPFALLIPEMGDQPRACTILALTAFSAARQVICWLSAWKTRFEASGHIVWRVTWLLLAPVAAYAVVAYAGIETLRSAAPFRHDLMSLALLALFIVALRNSWNLVLQHDGLLHSGG